MGLIDVPQSERTACTARSGRPRCPKCRARPAVQNAVQMRSGFEYLTLRCTSCGLVYDAQMHTDPLRSDARDWIDSELVPK
jgi:DNA-directed RNA polymerase subunit M/transcription elongation factor TFIIS